MISRSIHVAADGIISFFFMAEKYSTVCVCMCPHVCVHTHTPHHLCHSFVDGNSHCFFVLTVEIVLLWTLDAVSVLSFFI